MSSRVLSANRLKDLFWPLIKSRQTFLLTLTGIAGYLCQRPVPMDWPRLAGLVGSMLFTIGGCTVLNMVFDRDIDCKMTRTNRRPMAAGQVNVGAASTLGGGLIALGLLWSLKLSWLYFILALAGVGLDVLVYTLWLKRRTAWSIFWGGLSGGIPILAGCSLVTGRLELGGLLLAFAIVCWIPSHNLTLSILYSDDYLNAGLPTFLNVYGLATALAVMALSSLLTVTLMAAAFGWLHLSLALLAISGTSGLGLVGLALYIWRRSARQTVRVLYKFSSFYMLAAMLLLMIGTLP